MPSTTLCLDDAVIAALVDGRIDESTRSGGVAHLAECARCREVLSSATRALNNESVHRAAAATEPREWIGRAWKSASIAVAAAVVLLLWPRGESGVPALNEHRAPEITSGAAPIPGAPVGIVSQVSDLRWLAVAGADRYRVRLFDVGGHTLFETELPDTQVTLPDSVSLQRGTRYFWAIDARTDFNRWTPSGLIEFSIAPRRP